MNKFLITYMVKNNMNLNGQINKPKEQSEKTTECSKEKASNKKQ